MSKPLKGLAVGCTILLVLAGAAVLFATSRPGEGIIKGWIEDYLTTSLGQKVSIATLETNLWSRLTLDSVTIGADDGSRAPLISASHVKLGYSLPGLLTRPARLKLLAVDHLDIALTPDSLGFSGLALPDDGPSNATSTGSTGAGIRIDSIAVSHLGLGYRHQTMPITARATGGALWVTGGDQGSLAGQLSVASFVAMFDSSAILVRDFQTRGTFDHETLIVSELSASCEGLQISASGTIGLSDSGSIAIEAAASGTLDSLTSKLFKNYGLPPIHAAQSELTAEASGTLDDLSVKVRAEFEDLSVSTLAVSRASIQARYSDHVLSLDTLMLAALGGTISGTASTSLDSTGMIFVALALDSLDMAKLWNAAYQNSSPYQGTLRGNLRASGPSNGFAWESWTAQADITGTGLQYERVPIPELTCTVSLLDGKSNLVVAHGVDEVRADVTLHNDTLAGSFTAAVPDVAALARIFDEHELSGGIWARGKLAGTYSNPTVRARIEGARIVARHVPLDTMSASVSYAESGLTIEQLDFSGFMDSASVERVPWLPDSIGGTVRYNGTFSGNLNKLEGQLAVRSISPHYNGYALDSLTLKAGLNGSTIELNQVVLCRNNFKAVMTGMVDTASHTGSFQLELFSLADHSNDSTLSEFAGDSSAEWGTISGQLIRRPDETLNVTARGQGVWLGVGHELDLDTLRTQGILDFELVLDGPPMAPDAVLNARVKSMSHAGYRVDSLQTKVRLTQGELIFDSLVTFLQTQSLRTSGSVQVNRGELANIEIPEDAALKASIQIEEWDLSSIREWVVPQGDLAGRITATIAVGGTTSAPGLHGSVRVTDGFIRPSQDSVIVNQVDVSLGLADSTVTIERATAIVAGLPIDISGWMAFPDYSSSHVSVDVNVGQLGKMAVAGLLTDSTIDLEVVADTLNLAVFQPLLSEVRFLQGFLSTHTKISGALTGPQIHGTLSIGSLSGRTDRFNLDVVNGHAQVRFDGGRIRIDSSSAEVNQGTVSLSGTVEHVQGELSNIDMVALARKVTLKEQGSYTVTVDHANLNYRKQQETYVLSGDAVLGEVRMTKGVRPGSLLPWARGIESVDYEFPDLIARSKLDVRIRESDQIWVDNNLARVRLRSEIRIIGSPVRPNLTGLLKIEEGYLLYLDRRFQVNEGSLYFNDPLRFNPGVKLNASTKITTYRRTEAMSYTVSITAEGPLDQLQYGLVSEPALDQPDILALLTLGATRSELTRDDQNDQAGLTSVLKDRATMLTSRRVSNYISKKAGTLFGFDEFSIEGNLFHSDPNRGPQLLASKRLSERVDVTYTTTVGYLNEQRIRLGYRIAPRWSLSGETDRQGRSGMDLRYGLKFK